MNKWHVLGILKLILTLAIAMVLIIGKLIIVIGTLIKLLIRQLFELFQTFLNTDQ